eukprot:5211201-Pleurochrysis_carterae.AAC.3
MAFASHNRPMIKHEMFVATWRVNWLLRSLYQLLPVYKVQGFRVHMIASFSDESCADLIQALDFSAFVEGVLLQRSARRMSTPDSKSKCHCHNLCGEVDTERGEIESSESRMVSQASWTRPTWAIELVIGRIAGCRAVNFGASHE